MKLYKLLFSLIHAGKLKWFMNSKHCIQFMLWYFYIFVVTTISLKIETLFNNTFLFTCLMTEPVLSSFVLTKSNMRGSLLPQSWNNCSLGVVGLCYAQSNYVFKVAVVHTGLLVTFQAKIRLMARKSIAKGKTMLV